ncbi:hypothetical protein BGZ88_008333 [Linnemannia elongata]|jgi:hypothetical protein|uniref:Uncharacterized protein n=1 Tax=Linnemannia elongata AG-77 TaxID=1314771 RepID=A0A197JTM4_9FUNG|nr:hypothetical protein BGZ88_008333 [Linnemannia elongata]OAQ27791.1 hypothetical protein K457DRAFT_139216 [Linnemannia elongata AG-77]
MASMPFSPMSSPCDSYSYTRSVNTPMTNNNGNKYHSRSSSESLLFTPPLSPTEEQLLAFLIPDIEPSELAAYLSAPATPILSDVSCLIGKNLSSVNQQEQESCYNIEAVYPSPVCAAAAATVVAIDRLDAEPFPTLSVSPSTNAMATTTSTAASFRSLQSALTNSKKRSSMYAFVGSDDEEDKEEMPLPTDFTSSPTVYVMSSRNTRKRLMLEQAFVSPDEEDDNNSVNNCYSQIFHGASSDELDMTTELSSTLAYDLVLA